jgi:hypothetical protein
LGSAANIAKVSYKHQQAKETPALRKESVMTIDEINPAAGPPARLREAFDLREDPS